jgi:tetrapyrrole methylase family protein/MazG family protein
MIHIVGLGPGDPELITRATWSLIINAPEIRVRTREHPAVPDISRHTAVYSYDHLYESHDDFAAVYAAIAADVVARAARGDVIYAVPGDPSVAEMTPRLIQQQAQQADIPVIIHPAVSFLEPTFAALGEDPIRGVQVVDAQTLAATHHPRGSQGMGLLVPQLYSRLLAGDVKLTLMNAYPDDHPVTLISGAGTPDLRLRQLPLYELDRSDDLDDLTTLWVPPLPHAATYADLQDIIAHLRAPDGCPWDRKQTHQSLRPYLLEETYEVLDALDAEDNEALKEELGDLLIQVALHVQIATEEGEFKLADVIQHVVDKLIRRHPHVFGDVSVQNAEDVARNWEAIKQEERRQNGEAEKKKTLLDGIPAALPALSRAQTYVSRLSRVSYPLPEPEPLTEAELGRRLLTLVELAEAAGLEAEAALRAVTVQLREALIMLEAQAAARGEEFLSLDDETRSSMWRQWLDDFSVSQ